MNLVSNAIKFCDDAQGVVEIRLNSETDAVRVDVMDNGQGPHEEDQPIVFEKFSQVRRTGKARPPGSGFGLSITKRIIDFHRGRIWVTSTPGKGAVFSFRLPLGGPAQHLQ